MGDKGKFDDDESKLTAEVVLPRLSGTVLFCIDVKTSKQFCGVVKDFENSFVLKLLWIFWFEDEQELDELCPSVLDELPFLSVLISPVKFSNVSIVVEVKVVLVFV